MFSLKLDALCCLLQTSNKGRWENHVIGERRWLEKGEQNSDAR